MTEENEIAAPTTISQGGAFSSIAAFEDALRMVKPLTHSSLVPDVYRGEQGTANAVIALEIAQRIGASPLMVMQNLYIVHGRPAWSSQFIIAAINGCGRYEPLEFHMTGTQGQDDWGCYVTAKSRATGETLRGPMVTLGMANAEGWTKKNGSKWKTMPEVMLRYRAASFFGKNYAPDILMGMQTAEEMRDIGFVDDEKASRGAAMMDKLRGEPKDVTPTYDEIAEKINSATSADEVNDALDMARHLPEVDLDGLHDVAVAKLRELGQ